MDRVTCVYQARLAGALALVALLSACDERAPGSPGSAAQPQATAALPSSSADPPGAPEAAAAASVVPPPPALAGTWEGAYDAQKGSVELPPKTKDAARKKDDGKVSSGPGTVTLTVGLDGELRGKASGALGNATLVGKTEDDIVRASVFPDDPHAPLAMTGIFIGKLTDGVIRAEIRVTGPDATLVRESQVELKRK